MNRNAAITGSNYGFEWEARRRDVPGWHIVIRAGCLVTPVEVTFDETMREEELRATVERGLRLLFTHHEDG